MTADDLFQSLQCGLQSLDIHAVNRDVYMKLVGIVTSYSRLSEDDKRS